MICTACGEEVESGIMNWVEHWKICKRNAPNENIETHNMVKEAKELRKKEDAEFAVIFKKMSDLERSELIYLSTFGIIHGDMVLMGSKAYDRVMNFREKMKIKYQNR